MRSESCSHQHAVQFYENDDYLCDAVASFVADGLSVQGELDAHFRSGIST